MMSSCFLIIRPSSQCILVFLLSLFFFFCLLVFLIFTVLSSFLFVCLFVFLNFFCLFVCFWLAFFGFCFFVVVVILLFLFLFLNGFCFKVLLTLRKQLFRQSCFYCRDLLKHNHFLEIFPLKIEREKCLKPRTRLV